MMQTYLQTASVLYSLYKKHVCLNTDAIPTLYANVRSVPTKPIFVNDSNL